MKKIYVFEDEYNDVKFYYNFCKEHDSYLVPYGRLKTDYMMNGDEPFFPEKFKGVINPSKTAIPLDGDEYLVDGLEGICFKVIEQLKLPKDKVIIVSGNSSIEEDAIKKGYATGDKGPPSYASEL